MSGGTQVKVAEQIASSNQAFGILFILVLIVVFYYIRQMIIDGKEERKENRADAKEREKTLTAIIERQGESLERTTDALESIQETQKGLQEGQNKMERRLEKVETRFDQYDLSTRHFRELKIGRNNDDN
jgi:flagellar biosynthesis/type III secretory pathway M-ring protein FliF/YscJ